MPPIDPMDSFSVQLHVGTPPSKARSATTLVTRLAKAEFGVIRLDRHGRILSTNIRASALLRSRGGISNVDGRLRVGNAVDDDSLQALLSRALPGSGDRKRRPGSFKVNRAYGLPQLFLHVAPVGSPPDDFPDGAAALVLAVELRDREHVDADLVADVLGLSRAEAHLAELLARGHKLRDIAVTTGRNYSTLRWHLQNVYAKTGVSTQLDLVDLVRSLSSVPDVEQ